MRNHLLATIALLALLFCSCEEKKETRTIITKMEKPKVSAETKAMPEEESTKRFEWGDVYYEARLSRSADKELPIVTDADGDKYYDNAIALTIAGPSGNVVEKVFRKDDFSDYINSNYIKPSRSVLVNLIFTEIEGSNAVFVATVGSPDVMDDEFMLVRVLVSKSGTIRMDRVEEIE